jgi:hypothetical protein
VQGSVTALLASLPARNRSATGLSRWLSLKVPLCYRFIASASQSADPCTALKAMPGVQGFRMVLDACAKAEVEASILQPVYAAVNELEDLIAQGGGSLRKLLDELNAGTPAADEVSLTDKHEGRRAVFERMRNLLDCSMDGLVAVRIYSPAKQPMFADDLDLCASLGRVGFLRRTASMPFVLSINADGFAQMQAQRQTCLIEEFCSQPVPRTTLESREDSTMVVVDMEFEQRAPFDVFIGPLRATHLGEDSPQGSQLISRLAVNCPSRWLLHDIFLPRAWMAGKTMRTGVYMSSVHTSVRHAASQWYARLPFTHTPGHLGRGLSAVESDLYPRQRELCDWTFKAAGLDPADYVGFRLEVHYPVLFAYYTFYTTAE